MLGQALSIMEYAVSLIKECILSFFSIDTPIAYEGTDSDNALAFKYYHPEQIVLGKTMEEQLRLAKCLLAFIGLLAV